MRVHFTRPVWACGRLREAAADHCTSNRDRARGPGRFNLPVRLDLKLSDSGYRESESAG